MGSMSFQVVCGCGCPGVLMNVQAADLDAWRKLVNDGQIGRIACGLCGCEHDLADGTTQINIVSVPTPKVTSISASSGPAAGGTAVTLTGHRLNVGTLVVKFGGVPGVNMRSRSASNATVDSPPGKFHLMTTGVMTGTIAPGDTITGVSSGKTATVLEVHVDQNYLLVASPSGAFDNGEVVQKDAGNHVELAAIAQPLIVVAVNVTVENENGQRVTGGSLPGAFSYTTP